MACSNCISGELVNDLLQLALIDLRELFADDLIHLLGRKAIAQNLQRVFGRLAISQSLFAVPEVEEVHVVGITEAAHGTPDEGPRTEDEGRTFVLRLPSFVTLL